MKFKNEIEFNEYQQKQKIWDKVNFKFDDDNIFEGFTDGQLWNGWNQIYVNSDVFVMILDSWAAERNICISELIQTDWFDNEYDLPFTDEYQDLFDLNGFVTTIYKGLTENELQDLYQIQEFMESEIFHIEEDDDILKGLNDDLYNSLSKAISIFENKLK